MKLLPFFIALSLLLPRFILSQENSNISIKDLESLPFELLIKNAEILHEKGLYKEAILYADRAVKLLDKNENIEYQDQARAYFVQANIFSDLAKYQLADSLYRKAIGKFVSRNDTLNFLYGQCLVEQANLFVIKHQNNKAFSVLEKGLSIIKRSIRESDFKYGVGLGRLGGYYNSLGNYGKADSLFRRSLAIIEKSKGQNNAAYLYNLRDIGFIQYMADEYDKAIKTFIQALEISKNTYKKSHPINAGILYYLAWTYEIKQEKEKAENCYEQSLEIAKRTLGSDHPFYSSYLYGFSDFYVNIREFDKALPLALEGLELSENAIEMDSAVYGLNLGNVAKLYSNMGDHEKALPYALKQIEINKKIFGRDHKEYVYGLTKTVFIYSKLGEKQKADSLMNEAEEIVERALKGDSLLLLNLYLNMAGAFSWIPEYDKFLEYRLKIRDLVKKIYGVDHLNYSHALSNISWAYFYLGRYKDALPVAIQSVEIAKKTVGDKHQHYGIKLSWAGFIHQLNNQYRKAIELSIRASKILENTLGENHIDYLMCLSKLSRMYSDLGQYEKALSTRLTVIERLENGPGKNSPEYAGELINLGAVYMSLGQHDKAFDLILRGTEMTKIRYGPYNNVYGTALHGLAQIYLDKKDYANALKNQLISLEVMDQALGQEHIAYGRHLTQLSEIYIGMGDFESALLNALKSLDIAKNSVGKISGSYSWALFKLGKIYALKSEYHQALHFLKEAAQIRLKVFGQESDAYQSTIFELARLHEKMGNASSAADYFREWNQSVFSFYNRVYDQFSEAEQSTWNKKASWNIYSFHSFIIRNPEYESLIGLAYENQLFLKGLLWGNRKRLLQTVRNTENQGIKIEYEEWERINQLISRQYSMSIEDRMDEFDSLENRANYLESELARKSLPFKETRTLVSLEDVKSALNIGEAAIEFAHFRYYDKHRWTDSTFYCAYLVRPEYEHPKMIYLFEEKEVEAVLSDRADRRQAYVDQLYGYNRRGVVVPDNKAINLYDLIWVPIDTFLKGIEKIYFTPSGLLNRINLEAIAINEEEVLSDRFIFHALSSTKQLVFKKDDLRIKNEHAVIYGGIQYEMDSTAIIKSVQNQENEMMEESPVLKFSQAGRGGTVTSWKFLKHTETESTLLNSIFQDAQLKVELKQGYNANEESFKQIGRAQISPRILHIATHGYFFPDPKEEEDPNLKGKLPFMVAEHPLIRSGLILAGANQVWLGGHSLKGYDDGILTAYEIAQLDLSNTELVVLSACETGLGDIEDYEGVYGLQRAFKIAGAHSIIMSLWQIPDRQTKILMESFYRNWLEAKMPIRQSFSEAQRAMRINGFDPYYWAGFVLVE